MIQVYIIHVRYRIMQHSKWQTILQQTTDKPDVLVRDLGIANELVLSENANREFPIRATRRFIGKIRSHDPEDPLLRQIIPLANEEIQHPGFTADPLNEKNYMQVPGVLQKYHGRALLVVTGACAIHCRYCFRRQFPYNENNPASENWKQAIAFLDKDPSISEVILSGGDPLILADDRLTGLLHLLEQIPHLKRIRIHTRIPVVLPERINDALETMLARCAKSIVIVIHVNHVNELDRDTATAITRLKKTGAIVLNQSVLLRGINDTANDLVHLSEGLFAQGVLPYYLHMLDPVSGTGHFAVPENKARELLQELYERLPGYLVPRLVSEQPGARSKVPVELHIPGP